MRRLLAVAVALVVALGVMAAPAQAQAPAPKVTINGLIDMVSAWTKNISLEDLNLQRRQDSEWYSRTRLRPDIVGEVGTTKAVIGLEVDYIWGETAGGTRFGFGPSQLSAGRLNLDQTNVFELKWGYLEFDLPVVPVATRVRLGGQPASITYKPGVYWGGDFTGVHITSAVTPMIRGNFTYAQIQERSFGHPRFSSGDDFAVAVSVDITPFKGLDIKPIYSFLFAEGTTGGTTRLGRGGVSNAAAFFPNPGQGGPGTATEKRHTVGVDARWRSGPFSLAPTIFYQVGTREIAVAGALQDQDISAWYVDIRPGFTAGPLLLEGFLIYTTGNKAGDNLPGGSKVKYYQPINLDSGFYGGIADIWALNVDYLSAVYGTAGGVGFLNAVGYDKYGLINLGARATYSLTPALAFRGGVHARFAAEKVDTDGTLAAATGITPSAAASGDDRYLGTELNVGLTYRFAPNVAFDLVGAYLLAGDGLGTATATGIDGITRPNSDPKDIQKIAARVRYTF